MSRSTLALALHIARLIEEHSEKDIRAAVSLLEEHGIKSELLTFVARQGRKSATSSMRSSELPASHTAATNRALMHLRESEPEKFHVLSEFDRMIKRGQVLTTAEDLKRFGQQVSKDFQPRKSRKETIGPLIAMLTARPLSELKNLIELATSFGVEGNADEYQRLAEFLIKGKKE